MKKVAKQGLLAVGGGVLLAAASATVQAAEAVPTWYGAVMGSYLELDGDRDADSAQGLTALYGGPLTQSLAVESNLFYHRSKAESNSDNFNNWGVSADLNFRVPEMAVGQPFVLFGLGSTVEKQPGAKAGSYFFDAGIGMLGRRFQGGQYALRAEVRWYTIFNDTFNPDEDWLDDVRFNLGLQFGPRPVAAMPAPVPAPGVIFEPEPAPVPVPEPAKPRPVDSDGDGVVDSVDLCPGTTRGQRVDARGCVVLEEVKLSGVGFTKGSTTLTGSAKAVLDGVASALKARPEVKIEIAGYTDSVGSDAVNLALSQKRAESVRDYLASKGVDAGRLTAKGYGEVNPVDTNDTPAGRANNRRVEFRVR